MFGKSSTGPPIRRRRARRLARVHRKNRNLLRPQGTEELRRDLDESEGRKTRRLLGCQGASAQCGRLCFRIRNFHGRHPLEGRQGRRHANSSANSHFAKELQLIGSPEWQTLEIPPEKLRFLGNRDLLSENHEKTTDDDEEKV